MGLNKGYIQKQLYRIKIAGLGPFLKDAYLVSKQRMQDKAGGMPIHRLGDPNPHIKVLYVHSGWAIYNVGKLWFSHIPGLQCTFINADEFLQHPELQKDCDIVLFGYSSLLHLVEGGHLTKPIWAVVHDPLELYPESPDWESLPPNPHVIARLKKADRVITASHEIRAHLAKAGIGSFVIPTTSLLPSRPLEEIDGAPSGPVKVFTVGRIYPRKNYELFKKIGTAAHRSFGSRIQFSAKLDYAPLPETEYIRKLDTSDIYLVTSYQEGGPLPAMDAMLRGEIVLSTPVGQMPELIEDGYNGFICRTLDEFIARLDQLVKNPSLLRTMRRNALQRLQVARSREVIVEAVQKALVG